MLHGKSEEHKQQQQQHKRCGMQHKQKNSHLTYVLIYCVLIKFSWIIQKYYHNLFYFFLEKPGSPTITSSTGDIQATSLTVKWTPPADNGGSPITAYRVVILKGASEIKNVNITDSGTTSMSVGGLERNTEYIVKVFARNAVFEGLAGEKAMKTKFEGKQSQYMFLV